MQKTANICDTHISRSSVPSAEAALWGAKINTMAQDAIFPFRLPSKETPSLEKQFAVLIKKIKPFCPKNTKFLVLGTEEKYRIGHTSKQSLIDAALFFFESEAFDICMGYLNRENDVDRIFAFIQKATTLRKKYNILCMRRQMKEQKIKMSNLDERARGYIKGANDGRHTSAP